MSFLEPGRTRRRSLGGFYTSVTAHVVVVGLLVAVPALWNQPAPMPVPHTVIALSPPPPPPPPLPAGDPGLREDPTEQRRRTPEPAATPSPTDARDVRIGWRSPDAAPRDLSESEWGSETGSDVGVPEGMPDGVPGGVVGGVPGGQVGGELGGTGTGAASRVDRGPRLLHQTRPVYPHEAFVEKIEGTVVLEILIAADGRVAEVRVLRSIPALDAAAIRTVKQWRFEPALLRGRPVPIRARTPIHFKIY